MTSERASAPLALAVLREEIGGIEAAAQRLHDATDAGASEARLVDLVTSVERYLRLEHDVVYPVLERSDIAVASARTSQGEVHAAVSNASTGGAAAPPSARAQVIVEALQRHFAGEEATIFAAAASSLAAEMIPLGLELDEVRQRMRGAYGV